MTGFSSPQAIPCAGPLENAEAATFSSSPIRCYRRLAFDRSVAPLSHFQGGTKKRFDLREIPSSANCRGYSKDRNHPEVDGTSRLSPYLHFGHISPLTIALAVRKADAPKARKESFLNELLVWRELAINFVTYNPNYDNFESGEKWAHRTLAEHAKDPRPYLYSGVNWKPPRPTTRYGTPPSARWCDRLDAQLHAHVLGKEDSGMEPLRRGLPHRRDSTTTTSSTAATPTATPELPGPSPASSTVPGSTRPIFGQIRYMSGASTGKKFDSRRYIENRCRRTCF